MAETASTLASILGSPRLAAVDSLAACVNDKVNAVFGREPLGPQVKSILNGTPLRHRLHPALAQVSVGAWTTAFYLDVLALLGDHRSRRYYRSGADAAIALGIAGAVPAACSGMADWADVSGSPRRYGMVHALLNVAALSSYSISLAARRGKRRNDTLALASAGIGFVALSVAAAIGGELVYNLGVNVPASPALSPPEDFVDVLAGDELQPGDHRMVEVDDYPILLLRDERGDLRALQHWCPHAGAPLSEGALEDGVITCPWHGSRFCIEDGSPVRGPAATPLPVFNVREQDGRIFIGPPA